MNPIERLFTAIVQAAFDMLRALVRGIFGSPVTAAQRLREPIDIERAPAAALIDLRHRVLRQGKPRDTAHFDGDDEHATRHWIARRSDQVIAVATVLARTPPDADEPRWQLRGMAVDPTQQGLGVGAALLGAIEREVAEPLWCNARTSAAGFYRRYGWRQVGEGFDIPTVGPHVRMVRSPPDGAPHVR